VTYDQGGTRKMISKTATTMRMIPMTKRIIALLVTALGLCLREVNGGGGGG
jgi:hypothetical protein